MGIGNWELGIGNWELGNLKPYYKVFFPSSLLPSVSCLLPSASCLLPPASCLLPPALQPSLLPPAFKFLTSARANLNRGYLCHRY
ncbi:MAG: hypothetical protein F6K47_32815 [Symploca sp. SIO2E6]|nr:hypothetical protein [Symploca sp. SIO2E6]